MTLVARYNVPAPRYTSYPSVPYWDDQPDDLRWSAHVAGAYALTNRNEGISLYVHLPYCESLCTYCACNTRITVNHAVEDPYIDAVLREWKIYRNLFTGAPRIRQLHLGGGTPTFFSPDNLSRLVEGLLSGCEICENADFSFEGHPNSTTAEHLFSLGRLGFRRVSFGIQDFNPSVQKAIHRIQPLENVQRAVREAREAGYGSVNFDLVYGLPKQDEATIHDTITQVLALRPDRIAFYGYAHVPWIKPAQKAFHPADIPAGENKLRLYELGKTMLMDAGYRDVGMDHFALPGDELFTARVNGTLHRNFMGYTTAHTRLSIGLGASAISDCWTAFSQNVKRVELYSAMTAEGVLPRFKGHELSPADLRIRRQILDLMCRFSTSLAASAPETADIVSRLRGMESDGLVSINAGEVKVTDAGKPFLRNICMAFDERHWQKAARAQFSQVA